MTGWAIFAGLAMAAAAGLYALHFPPLFRRFALAAILLAAIGYGWQGRPELAGARARPATGALALSDETIELRSAMFGRYGSTAAYLTPADAMMRFGAADAAAQLLRGGINREPGNIALWTQLGTVIATRDRAVSPAAALAFRRAIALAPGEPAPWFFLGLAEVRAGRFAQARAAWTRALALTPESYGYRPAIAQRLALLDGLLAAQR